MTPSDEDAFTRGYIVCGYLLGHKDCELPSQVQASRTVTLLSSRLSNPDRNTRAQALGRELSDIVRRISKQRLG